MHLRDDRLRPVRLPARLSPLLALPSVARSELRIRRVLGETNHVARHH